MERRPLRLLHTSDLHLGARADDPHLDALEKVMAVGREARVDAFLLAGDIFDHSRVKQPILDEVVERMAGPIPIVILPGNHDCLVEGGVYERGAFDQGNAQVLGLDGGDLLALHDIELSVWGKAHRHHRDLLPLRDPPQFEPNGWRVAIAHGHLVRHPDDHRRAYRIFPEDLEAQKADYVALGHWDVFSAVPARVPVSYSGSPLYAGTVNLVELDAVSGVRFVRVPVG